MFLLIQVQASKQKVTGFALCLILITLILVFGYIGSAKAIPAPKNHNQFVADVSGDGKGDAITFDPGTGDWWVAPISGAQFSTPSRWIQGFGKGTSRQFVSDVSGDNKADAVTFDKKTGDWWVAISNGTGFSAYSRWMTGHGVGSDNQLLGDINGGGRADAVIMFGNGSWYGSISSGNTFETPGGWFLGGHGVGSDKQFLADVTGDGRAEPIVYSNKTSDWWVINSNGVIFTGGPNRWAQATGIGSMDQFVADVNGDGKSDIIISDRNPYHPTTPYAGFWEVGLSSSTLFNPPSIWNTGALGLNTHTIMFVNVVNDSSADFISFDLNAGNWNITPSTGTSLEPFYVLGISGFGIGTK